MGRGSIRPWLIPTLVCGIAAAAMGQDEFRYGSDFKVTSRTFPNDGTMPVSTVDTIPSSTAPNVNICHRERRGGGVMNRRSCHGAGRRGRRAASW